MIAESYPPPPPQPKNPTEYQSQSRLPTLPTHAPQRSTTPTWSCRWCRWWDDRNSHRWPGYQAGVPLVCRARNAADCDCHPFSSASHHRSAWSAATTQSLAGELMGREWSPFFLFHSTGSATTMWSLAGELMTSIPSVPYLVTSQQSPTTTMQSQTSELMEGGKEGRADGLGAFRRQGRTTFTNNNKKHRSKNLYF